MPILKVEDLTHVYSQGTPFEKVAIDHISTEIHAGEVLGIIGHTGSGKSTFIQHLNGLLKPTSGKVLFDGADIHATREATRDVRFQVGLVFQYPEYQLFEETVFKDIAFGPRNMGLSESEIGERVREAAYFADVPEALLESSPLELSGGQKRRVAIAGVIAMLPKVLILDEPTAGLDPAGRESILQRILDYRRETEGTVLLISHSMDDIARVATRLLVFDRGRIAMDGTPAQVFERAEQLKDMGLTVPAATEIALALRRRGIDIPESIYTINYLRKLLVSLGEGDAPC
ncbi:MAG: energy-coupling factor transporter ATPase [Ruminococcaceae bacterium]|nr:energy-coupling factor transporter ATPase [Oscillospiraceae bacterium]